MQNEEIEENRLVTKDANLTIDYNQVIKPYHRMILALIEKQNFAGKIGVFDVGCGNGNTLKLIEEKFENITFSIADIDPKCLEICE